MIYRSSIKVCLHYAEAVFDLISLMGNFKYILYRIVKICGDCVESIKFFFFFYLFGIKNVFGF